MRQASFWRKSGAFSQANRLPHAHSAITRQLHSQLSCDIKRAAVRLNGPPRPVISRASARASGIHDASPEVGTYENHEAQASYVDIVKSLFDSFNRRDMSVISDLVDDTIVFENRASSILHGRSEVLGFYFDIMTTTPRPTKFVLDNVWSEPNQSKVAVDWHVEVGSLELPFSRGRSVYTFGATGKLVAIKGQLRAAGRPCPASAHAGSSCHHNGQPTAVKVGGISEAWATGRASASFSEQGAWEDLASSSYGSSSSSSPTGSGSSSGSSSRTSSSSSSGKAGSSSSSSSSVTPQQRVPTKRRSHSSSGGVPMRVLPDPALAATASTAGRVTAAAPAAAAHGSSGEAAASESMPAQEPAATASREEMEAPANLSGIWSKDLEASDGVAYEGLLDMIGLTGLKRMTARLIEGIEITHTPGAGGRFDVAYLTVVPFFSVTESARLGQRTSMMRRDLEFGQQTSVAEEVPGGVRITLEWGQPRAGTLQETYTLAGDQMSLTSVINMGGRSLTAHQVYRRVNMSREQFLRESKKRNPSLDQVLSRQQQQFGASSLHACQVLPKSEVEPAYSWQLQY